MLPARWQAMPTPRTTAASGPSSIAAGRSPTLAPWAGPAGSAHGLNDAGVVTGWSYTLNNSEQRAFYRTTGAMQDLNGLVAACSGRVLRQAEDVNNAGQFVGYGSSRH